MNLKIYLDSKPDKEGKCQIFFVLVGQGSRSKIYSGFKCNPDNWKDGQVLKGEDNHTLKNSIIKAKASLIDRIISEAGIKMIQISPTQVKKEFNDRMDKDAASDGVPVNRLLLVNYCDYYKKQYEGIREHNTTRAIKQVRDHIEKFSPKVSLIEVNHKWLTDYCKYLVSLGLEDSSIKDRHLKTIKGVCKDAMKDGIRISPQVEQFRWKTVEKQPFFADWEEVLAIQNIDNFVRNVHEKARDLFILSCYTGLRESDLGQLKKENFHKQGGYTMLRVRMEKTNFDYSIPLAPVVLNILNKYRFEVPAMSQGEYNIHIKTVAGRVVTGKYSKTKISGGRRRDIVTDRHKMFTTHTARRSFGRRFLDKGGSLIVLSKIFGHQTTETTLKYIGYQPQEVVTEYLKAFS